MAPVGAEDTPAMPKPKPSYSTIRRWTEKEARAALSALAASRLSIRAFAAREGLDHQRLYCWQRKLAVPVAREAAPPPTFVELRPSVPERVEIVLRCGIVLRVRETIDASALRHLVETLEPSC